MPLIRAITRDGQRASVWRHPAARGYALILFAIGGALIAGWRLFPELAYGGAGFVVASLIAWAIGRRRVVIDVSRRAIELGFEELELSEVDGIWLAAVALPGWRLAEVRYEVALVEPRRARRIYACTEELRARQVAELCSRAIGAPLSDATGAEVVTRQARELDRPLGSAVTGLPATAGIAPAKVAIERDERRTAVRWRRRLAFDDALIVGLLPAVVAVACAPVFRWFAAVIGAVGGLAALAVAWPARQCLAIDEREVRWRPLASRAAIPTRRVERVTAADGHLTIASDDAAIVCPVASPDEARWLEREVLAALAATSAIELPSIGPFR